MEQDKQLKVSFFLSKFLNENVSNIYKIYNSLFKEAINRLVSLRDFKARGFHSLKTLLHCSKTSDVAVQTRKHNSYNSYVTSEGLVAAPLATSSALESHRNVYVRMPLCAGVCVCLHGTFVVYIQRHHKIKELNANNFFGYNSF